MGGFFSIDNRRRKCCVESNWRPWSSENTLALCSAMRAAVAPLVRAGAAPEDEGASEEGEESAAASEWNYRDDVISSYIQVIIKSEGGGMHQFKIK